MERISEPAASSVSTHFMFAMIFIGIWPLTNWIPLFGAVLFAAWGSMELCKRFRATPPPDRRRVLATDVVAALAFLVVAQVQLGYHAGKFMALQDNARCAALTQGTPGHASRGCVARTGMPEHQDSPSCESDSSRQ